MRPRAAVAGACALAALSLACSSTTRHKVLTFFFDGVPPLQTAEAAPGAPSGAPAAAGVPREVPRDHGPYAARLCGACHLAQATNALIAPRDQICFRCHEIALNRKYVHGPIASGGCLVCHDPHASGNRALLVSGSDRFCFHCHDRDVVHGIAGHEGLEEGCTDCHDAHASDERFLLR